MKKSLLTLAVATTSVASFATVSESSSWAEIFAAPGVVVEAPKGVSLALGGISNVCVSADGKTLQTLKPQTFCLEGKLVTYNQGNEGEYTEWVCTKSETRHASQPRAVLIEECVEYNTNGGGEGDFYCVKFEEKPHTVPVKMSLEVSSFGQEIDTVLFSKNFEIPKCK